MYPLHKLHTSQTTQSTSIYLCKCCFMKRRDPAAWTRWPSSSRLGWAQIWQLLELQILHRGRHRVPTSRSNTKSGLASKGSRRFVPRRSLSVTIWEERLPCLDSRRCSGPGRREETTPVQFHRTPSRVQSLAPAPTRRAWCREPNLYIAFTCSCLCRIQRSLQNKTEWRKQTLISMRCLAGVHFHVTNFANVPHYTVFAASMSKMVRFLLLSRAHSVESQLSLYLDLHPLTTKINGDLFVSFLYCIIPDLFCCPYCAIFAANNLL